MSAEICPDRAELVEFAVGSLSGHDFTRVADHIDGCRRCEAALEDLDHVADPIVSQLRHLSAAEAFQIEPVPAGLIAAVRGSAVRGVAAAWAAREDGSRRMGKFELLERLGAGSFGFVYRARDTELARVVAIKILRAGSLASAEDAARFLREARSAAQLQHPGIVSLLETGATDDGGLFLVEEFV